MAFDLLNSFRGKERSLKRNNENRVTWCGGFRGVHFVVPAGDDDNPVFGASLINDCSVVVNTLNILRLCPPGKYPYIYIMYINLRNMIIN